MVDVKTRDYNFQLIFKFGKRIAALFSEIQERGFRSYSPKLAKYEPQLFPRSWIGEVGVGCKTVHS
jgi:hypothetical protein